MTEHGYTQQPTANLAADPRIQIRNQERNTFCRYDINYCTGCSTSEKIIFSS